VVVVGEVFFGLLFEFLLYLLFLSLSIRDADWFGIVVLGGLQPVEVYNDGQQRERY
jgi:hypothetical protein